MFKFTIKRSEWDRGRGKAPDRYTNPIELFNPRREQNNKCCLGFFALGCSFSLNEIKHQARIGELLKEQLSDEFLKVQRREDEYISWNDVSHITEAEREFKLTTLFAEDGIEVEFVD